MDYKLFGMQVISNFIYAENIIFLVVLQNYFNKNIFCEIIILFIFDIVI